VEVGTAVPFDRLVIKLLALALCAAVSVIAGQVAGILTFATGAGLAAAFLTGGGAFLTVLPVTLMVAAALGAL
jgi:hypothetical protein